MYSREQKRRKYGETVKPPVKRWTEEDHTETGGEKMATCREIEKMVMPYINHQLDETQLEQFLKHEPGYYDVILMDIRMPVMDGLAATRCIRESDHSDSKTVPIVAMTANVFEEDVKKSFDAGMNAHLSKPVDIKQMYAVLDELITGDGLL